MCLFFDLRHQAKESQWALERNFIISVIKHAVVQNQLSFKNTCNHSKEDKKSEFFPTDRMQRKTARIKPPLTFLINQSFFYSLRSSNFLEFFQQQRASCPNCLRSHRYPNSSVHFLLSCGNFTNFKTTTKISIKKEFNQSLLLIFSQLLEHGCTSVKWRASSACFKIESLNKSDRFYECSWIKIEYHLLPHQGKFESTKNFSDRLFTFEATFFLIRWCT